MGWPAQSSPSPPPVTSASAAAWSMCLSLSLMVSFSADPDAAPTLLRVVRWRNPSRTRFLSTAMLSLQCAYPSRPSGEGFLGTEEDIYRGIAQFLLSAILKSASCRRQP